MESLILEALKNIEFYSFAEQENILELAYKLLGSPTLDNKTKAEIRRLTDKISQGKRPDLIGLKNE